MLYAFKAKFEISEKFWVHCALWDEGRELAFFEYLSWKFGYRGTFKHWFQWRGPNCWFLSCHYYKKYNLSFCTCLDKYISFLAFSITFWGIWPIEHLPPIRSQLRQSFGFDCFEGQRSVLVYWAADDRAEASFLFWLQCCNLDC